MFEGTTTSVGRGTDAPFQQYGHPSIQHSDYSFTPQPGPGSKRPKHKGLLCRGYSLKNIDLSSLQQIKRLELSHWINFYQQLNEEAKNDFFLANNFFNKLAGNTQLMQQIKKGIALENIYQSWEPQLGEYKKMRQKYLLYP